MDTRKDRVILMLIGLCLIVVCCTGCGFASLSTVVDIALSSFGIAMVALAKILPAGDVTAINGVMAKFQALWTDVKSAVNSYLSGTTSGVLSEVEAALSALQSYLPDVEDAAGIKNPVLQAVIAAILAAANGALTYIVENVLPKTTAAMQAYQAGNPEPAHALDKGMKGQALALRSEFETQIAASGLDAATVKEIHDKMEKATHFHLGPFGV